jgi:hypothetical protein
MSTVAVVLFASAVVAQTTTIMNFTVDPTQIMPLTKCENSFYACSFSRRETDQSKLNGVVVNKIPVILFAAVTLAPTPATRYVHFSLRLS